MQDLNNNEVYKNMFLTIPDLVLADDIPNIINWFHYYGIADVKNVKVLHHSEPEYYVEDKSPYGYAIIEISEWYMNNCSLSFYENIIAGSAKIVYDDPKYWNVEFYETKCQKEENTVIQNLEKKFDKVKNNKNEEIKLNIQEINEHEKVEHEVEEDYEEKEHKEKDDEEKEEKVEDYEDEDYEHEDEDYEDEEKEEKEDQEKVEDYEQEDEDYEHEEDEDYEEKEDELEDDLKYEYIVSKRHKMETRSNKIKRKENKSKTNNLNTENITLKELIVKKNKNYVKKDKRKPFKNEWTRRLRQKLNI
tara:strand:+ start:545 stop:1456 length:912 start_codon:yes stop_codon:yes gene_type:complete